MRAKKKVAKKKQHSNGGIMNEIITKQTADSWATPQMSADDLVIPKILAMQGLSDAVTNGTAKFGEFRESIGNNLIGSIEKPFEFIPVFAQKLWLVFDATTKKKEFLKTVPLTEANKDHPFEGLNPETKKNEQWQRVYSFYVLLPDEVKAGSSMPYIINFKGTSFQAGKILFTQSFIINARTGGNPASLVMRLHGEKQSNDMGTFVVMKTAIARKSSAAEIAEALKWNGLLQTLSVKPDHVVEKKIAPDEAVPF